MGAVAEAVVQRVDDEVALDGGDGAADQRAGDAAGCGRGLGIGRCRAAAACGCSAETGMPRPPVSMIASGPIIAPCASRTARCMVFSSSRTLPRQRGRAACSMASGAMPAIRTPLASAYFLREVLGQRGDVAPGGRAAAAAPGHDVEAEEQVLAEAPFAHLFLQVAVGGREQADVDLDRRGAADAVDHALLDGAQQLGLQARMSISLISSSSRVPPLASSNLPMRRATAPVKAPFSWPNSSDSSRFSGIAAQLTEMNGLLARLDLARGCSAPSPPCRCRTRR